MSTKVSELNVSRSEFVAIIAMMFATIAFSVDAMLPALPQMGLELSPLNPDLAPLILTAFIFGMGLGTFISGPLSDAFGRKRIIYIGSSLYIVSAIVAWVSQSLEILLIARAAQGLGASAPRIVAVAIVRDLFAGREMARIVSFIMLIFTLVPAVAPALGTVIIEFSDWRGIFVAFMLFSSLSVMWLGLRLPETLDVQDRRPLKFDLIWDALKELFSHPSIRLSIMVQTLALSMLFTILMTVQPVYSEIYDRADSFPIWFGVVALIAGTGSIANAYLVVRLGMRRVVTWTMGAQMLVSLVILAFDLYALPEPYGFAVFVFWQTTLFFQAGLTLGNLNAIAMEPVGHIAGMAASVIGSVSTVMAAIIASPVGLAFDGSLTRPLFAVTVLAALSCLLMIYMGRVEARLGNNS